MSESLCCVSTVLSDCVCALLHGHIGSLGHRQSILSAMAKCTERNTKWPAFKLRSVIACCCLQQGQVSSHLAEASLHRGSQIFSLSLRGHFLSLLSASQISNQSICLCMHLPTACTWCVIGAKPSHRLLVLSHANLCGDG